MLIFENIEFLDLKMVQVPFCKLLGPSRNNDKIDLFEKTVNVKPVQSFFVVNLQSILHNLLYAIQDEIYLKI